MRAIEMVREEIIQPFAPIHGCRIGPSPTHATSHKALSQTPCHRQQLAEVSNAFSGEPILLVPSYPSLYARSTAEPVISGSMATFQSSPVLASARKYVNTRWALSFRA